MKTTMSKQALKNFRGDYLNLQAQVDKARRQYQTMRENQKKEEEAILGRMFTQTRKLGEILGRAPTAREISVAMGREMSTPEIVGQLLVAAGEHYNGASYPRPTTQATHTTTQAMKHKVKIDVRMITKRYAEINADGELVENGRVIAHTTRQNTYKVAE